MTFKQTFSLAALALSLSTGIAFAAAMPANVKSVQATGAAGTITVLWSPVPGAVSYRVYYSHESILENAGNYDDFVQTPDSQMIYTFNTPPLQSEKIYFGVLAVDRDGNESEGFEVETSIDTPAPPESSASSEPAPEQPSSEPMEVMPAYETPAEEMPAGENPTSTAVPMGIEAVEVISATGVLITFTKEIDPGAIMNPDYFLITTATGVTLPVRKVDMHGKQVLLSTDPVAPNTEYVLSLLSIIPAADGTNATPSEPQVRFRAPPTGTPPPPAGQQYGRNPELPGPPPAPATNGYQPAPPFDASNLGLTASLRSDGTYNVIARWSPSPNAESYSLYTSRNGSPYSWNSAVQKNDTTIQYSGIAPGTFGVRVTARARNLESPGIDKVITLPASGLGIVGIAAVAGAGAVSRRKKRKLV